MSSSMELNKHRQSVTISKKLNVRGIFVVVSVSLMNFLKWEFFMARYNKYSITVRNLLLSHQNKWTRATFMCDRYFHTLFELSIQ